MKIMTATIRPCTETENEYRLTESHEAIVLAGEDGRPLECYWVEEA